VVGVVRLKGAVRLYSLVRCHRVPRSFRRTLSAGVVDRFALINTIPVASACWGEMSWPDAYVAPILRLTFRAASARLLI
jgi:hypothetical protein